MCKFVLNLWQLCDKGLEKEWAVLTGELAFEPQLQPPLLHLLFCIGKTDTVTH